MTIADNLKRILDTINNAESRCLRKPGSVRLLAVSKFNPPESVLQALKAGQTLFGENRVQEACEKFPAVFSGYPKGELHFIGTLQRNKVKQIAGIASCIQSVDRPELLFEIEKQAGAIGRILRVLFEYHTGEASKSGFQNKDSLFAALDLLDGMKSVRCAGLMTIAPYTSDQSEVRKAFRTLHKIREECTLRYPSVDFSELSMGMSSDFSIAIEEGSTMVRIGTAIFGERPHV